MKLVTFSIQTPLGLFERLGSIIGNGHVSDLNAAYAWNLKEQGEAQPYRISDAIIPPDMTRFLEGGTRSMDAAREAAASLASTGNDGKLLELRGPRQERLVYAMKEIRLKAPLPRPSSLRDFIAFEEHAKQGAARRGDALAKEWYEMPIYYKGNHREIYGPDEEVPWPSYTRKFDFELEIGCVVGRKGRDLTPEEALKHIAGYTILNDFSARDIQKKEMMTRLGPGKGKDFATGLGPYLLTADEMPQPGDLKLTAKVNGETWSEGNSGDCHWNFAAMLSHISQEETVYPGDVLGSGTFYRGCGLDLNRWVQPGDVIELAVDKLGTLRNVVGRPKADSPLDYSAKLASK